MKLIRTVAIVFAFVSTVYWTAVTGLQFAAFRLSPDAPIEYSGVWWALATVLPFLLYALACFFLFHWLKRRIAKVLTTRKD